MANQTLLPLTLREFHTFNMPLIDLAVVQKMASKFVTQMLQASLSLLIVLIEGAVSMELAPDLNLAPAVGRVLLASTRCSLRPQLAMTATLLLHSVLPYRVHNIFHLPICMVHAVGTVLLPAARNTSSRAHAVRLPHSNLYCRSNISPCVHSSPRPWCTG